MSVGGISVRFHRRGLGIAALVFVGAMGVGSGVFMHLKEPHGSSATESVKGFDLMEHASPNGQRMVAVVDEVRVDDPAIRAAVLRSADRLRQLSGITAVQTAYDDPMLRAPDGRASLIVISTGKTTDMMAMHNRVQRTRDLLGGSVPGAEVKVGGDLAVMRDSAVTA